MPEATSNIEFANKIHEQGHHHGFALRLARGMGRDS